MRYVLLTLLLIFPALASAQELHTFSNGEVADAEKINQNFEALKSEISGSGGCSAQQDGSSVVITCADGTSGVLASEGTMVTFLEGIKGEVPVSFNTGTIVVKDGLDNTLGEYVGRGTNDRIRLLLQRDPHLIIEISNSLESVQLTSAVTGVYAYFDSENCSGTPFASENMPSAVLAGTSTPPDKFTFNPRQLRYSRSL